MTARFPTPPSRGIRPAECPIQVSPETNQNDTQTARDQSKCGMVRGTKEKGPRERELPRAAHRFDCTEGGLVAYVAIIPDAA